MTGWLGAAPELDTLEPGTRTRLAGLHPADMGAGTTLFRPGDSVQGYVIVLEGRIDVHLTGATGRDILLYSVAPGQSCIQSTMGLLGADDYTAEAVTAMPSRVVMLPREMFLDLIETSPEFRKLVFHAFATRFQNMMQLLEKVSFMRVESRLAERLLAEAGTQDTLRITQAALATQVGTAREVVSRRLEAWARKGWVATGRGTVTLLDRPALESILRTQT